MQGLATADALCSCQCFSILLDSVARATLVSLLYAWLQFWLARLAAQLALLRAATAPAFVRRGAKPLP